jgi:SAM-dependent methyltransferase
VRINDPAVVAGQYACEGNLETRRSIYANAEGVDPREVAFQAVADAQPTFVLEVGGGPGELAERVGRELGARVVMVDSSERMVELARERGVDARVGDVQDLPFTEARFDCAVAAWMLYHVPDLDRGLSELARVLRPGARLVAVTNASDHLLELRRLAGGVDWERPFSRANGADLLRRHFSRVERRDVDGWLTIEDAAAARDYLASISWLSQPVDLPPFEAPLRVRRASSVFVAEK